MHEAAHGSRPPPLATHLFAQNVLVDVGGENGGGRQEGGIRRRHDGGGDGADPDDGQEAGGDVLQGEGQDEGVLATGDGGRRPVQRSVPVCAAQTAGDAAENRPSRHFEEFKAGV